MSVAVVLSRPRGRSFVSWGIRKFTSSDVSHASIHFMSHGGVLGRGQWVFESGGHGLVLVPKAKWDKSNDTRYRFTLKGDYTEIGYTALKSSMLELGTEYDFAGVGRFALYVILKKISPCLADRMVRSTPDQLFCSELVLRVLHLMGSMASEGFEYVMDLIPDATSPEDLKALRKCYAWEVEYANPGSV